MNVLLLFARLMLISLSALPWYFAGLHNGSFARQEASSATFEATPTKGVFAKGETVEVKFRLRNNGRAPIIVPRALRLRLSVDLEISDGAGKESKWCGRIADQVIPSKIRYLSLAPGQSLDALLAISCVDKDNPNRAWGYLVDSPGKYTFKAKYRLPQPKEFFESLFPNQDVARGPILAEPFTIEIR